MWKELVKNLSTFSNAVVTGIDADGYPFSVRCIPQVDHARQVLHILIPPGMMIQPGKAGLLCHSHDEWLWNIKSFIVRGTLEPEGKVWIFRPKQFIPGGGIGGFVTQTMQMFKWRRSAKLYVQKRGMSWPAVQWEEFKVLRAKAKQNTSSG